MLVEAIEGVFGEGGVLVVGVVGGGAAEVGVVGEELGGVDFEAEGSDEWDFEFAEGGMADDPGDAALRLGVGREHVLRILWSEVVGERG